MAEDEMESFEITDYDLQNEFGFSHKRKWLTKEQQIYGMWAESSDGEEGERAAQPPTASVRSSLKAGMNFIAGGVQQSGKTEEKLEVETESRPIFGGHYDSSDEEDPYPKSILKELGNSKKSSAKGFSGVNNRKTSEIAGMRRQGNIAFKEGGIGDWEKHTTGIGSKLMKMMGYEEGKGLGKNLQGMSAPVEANKRKGKGAIGYYGQERPHDIGNQDVEVQEKSKFEEQLQQWRKGGSKKKIKYVYKSAEEAIQEGRSKKYRSESDNHITKTKVIDMTGPETRVLSSYHAIAGQKTILDEYEEVKNKNYEYFDLPELIHNLQILLEKSEDDIVRNAKTLEKAEDRIVLLNHEREKYETLLEREDKELDSIDEALTIITKLETKHAIGVLTLDEAASLLGELKSMYTQIFYSYEIPFLAPTYVNKLFKELFSAWNPLSDPQQHLKTMGEWQNLIEIDGSQILQPTAAGQPMDPYHQVVWEAWTPCVRSAIMGPWEPRDSEPLLVFLGVWTPPIIPLWVQSHLLQNIALPRITQAVNTWNPMQDTVPIHTWIHPWLPLLADHLAAVYPVIRQKLSAALIHWHPSDRSAKMVLQPWKRVFSEVSMTTLIQANIQPKLESALLEMSVAPHNQKLDCWQWFTDWEDMLPTQIIIDILDKCFFPRWYQALGAWLSTNPPYPEVISWYKGWRDIMPDKAANHLQVQQKFQQSLEICRRALGFQPGAAEQFSLLLSGLENISDPPPPPPLDSPPKQPIKDWARRENRSMREVVESRCEERGIIFIPVPERNHEGRPVYRCGNLTISFNKNIIYVHTERGWMPKSLVTLLDDA